jgi:UDP-glucose 4-epimerase
LKILLTGGTGFIGRNLIPALTGEHEVFAVTRTTPPESDGVTWVEQDLAAPLDHSKLPPQIDAVIHMAQSKHYREFPGRADDVFAVNVHSTQRLLEYAREAGAERFLLASTGGVYGSSERAVSEGDRLNPLNFYMSSKYSAEALVWSYAQFFKTVTFRFFFVYGPGQDRMLVPLLLGRVLGGETITIDGDPGLRINPIYVGDAVRAIVPALSLPESDTFNVAGDEVVTIRELVNKMEEASGKTATIEGTGTRNAEGDLIGENTRMKDVLGVKPETGLADGLRSML